MQTRYQLLLICGIIAIIAIPLILKIVPPNRLYGFRTRQTLSDLGIWYRANAFLGWLLLAASCLSGGILALGPDNLLVRAPVAMAVFLLPILCVLIVCFLYSRRLTGDR